MIQLRSIIKYIIQINDLEIGEMKAKQVNEYSTQLDVVKDLQN